MVQQISTIELQHQMDSDRPVKIIDVLSSESFAQFHLPKAENVPLDEDFEKNILKKVPEKQHPVVVYCKDERCEASAKAARKLEDLGYTNVYDYRFGKEGWKQATKGSPSLSF